MMSPHFTPLHAASRDGVQHIVRLLLDRGFEVESDIKKCDNVNPTPLMYAAEEGHVEVARMLLDGGASVNRVERTGRTPLYMACAGGHVDVVRLLLQKGASVDPPFDDHHGTSAMTTITTTTPLIIASSMSSGHVEIVRLLLDAGASVNLMDADGRTALMWAAASGWAKIVEVLARRGGAGVDDDHDDKARNLADEKGYPEIARWLGNVRGFTPLHFACEAGDATEVRRLLRSDDVDVHAWSRAYVEYGGPRKALEVATTEEVSDILRRACGAWSSIPDVDETFPDSFRSGARAMANIKERVHALVDVGCRHGTLNQHGDYAVGKNPLMEVIHRVPEHIFIEHIMSFCTRTWFVDQNNSSLH